MGTVSFEKLDEAVDEVQTFGNKIYGIALCIIYPIVLCIDPFIASFIESIHGYYGCLTVRDFSMALVGIGLGIWVGSEGLAHRLEKILMQNTN